MATTTSRTSNYSFRRDIHLNRVSAEKLSLTTEKIVHIRNAAYTATAADLLGGTIMALDTLTANRTVTLPTAALIVARFARNGNHDGRIFSFTVTNRQAAAFNVLLAAGAGVTLNGKVILGPGETALYEGIITNNVAGAETVLISSVSSEVTASTAVPLAADTTLTVSQSGQTFQVTQGAMAAITLTLPAAADGLEYYFVLTTAAAQDAIIASASAMFGTLIGAAAIASLNDAAPGDVRFDGGVAQVADTIRAVGTAAGWWITGVSGVVAGIID